jgi:hypothetical protein
MHAFMLDTNSAIMKVLIKIGPVAVFFLLTAFTLHCNADELEPGELTRCEQDSDCINVHGQGSGCGTEARAINFRYRDDYLEMLKNGISLCGAYTPNDFLKTFKPVCLDQKCVLIPPDTFPEKTLPDE